jgi:hypothetical protein
MSSSLKAIAFWAFLNLADFHCRFIGLAVPWQQSFHPTPERSL